MIKIGCRYVRPPLPMSADQVLIQRALLSKPIATVQRSSTVSVWMLLRRWVRGVVLNLRSPL